MVYPTRIPAAGPQPTPTRSIQQSKTASQQEPAAQTHPTIGKGPDMRLLLPPLIRTFKRAW